MDIDTFETLKTLSEAPGPSGNEGDVAQIIRALWERYVDEFATDRLGNAVAVKHGSGPKPRPRIMLAAHLDEIGLLVKQIDEQNGSGFLRVTNVGGVDRRHLYGQTAVVHGKRELVGVIGALPERMLPESKHSKPFDFEDLLLDVGLPADELRELVRIGDFVTFRQPLRKLQGSLVAGKALDNRASVAAVTGCLAYLNGRSHAWDVVAVATVQEETRLLGAFTAAYAQRPDAAIAIDVTFGKGPGVNDSNSFDLGSGPVLDMGPNVHPGMYKALKQAAQALELSVCTGTHARASGTDAYAIQIAREGIPTGLVSIPLRYMHTMVETIDTNDVERVGRLLGETIARLDENFLDNLVKELMGEETSD